MRKLKLNFSLLGFAALLTTICLLTSCEQDTSILGESTQLTTPEFPDEETIQRIESSIEFQNVPDLRSLAQITGEYTGPETTNRQTCLSQGWNWFPHFGRVYWYTLSSNVIYLEDLGINVTMYDRSDICSGGFMYYVSDPFCGRTGWMYDWDFRDSYFLNWKNGQWHTVNACISFPT